MSGRDSQGAVPKFGSFKPKNLPQRDLDGGQNSNTTSYDPKERRHHHHHHRRSRSRERAHSQGVEQPAVGEIPKEEASTIYTIDKKGDVKNLVYGSVHRYSVPPFHRVGAGRVLGAMKWLKIDRDLTNEKGIVLSDWKIDLGGRREKYVFARNEKNSTRLLRIRPQTAADMADTRNADFVPFSENLRKRKRLDGNSDEETEESRANYRSIEGKAKPSSKPEDDALEYVTASDDSDSDSGRAIKLDETIRAKTIELSRDVDENPQEIESWIALIAHQDKLLGLSDDGRRTITSAERRSTADVKLHLYEKALVKAGTTLATRERLLLGLMAEGSKIWDFKTRSQKWEEVSQDNLESILLWKQYLDFRQSSFSSFRYEEVKTIFLKRSKLLRNAIRTRQDSEASASVLFESIIYTTLRATIFMRESGYSELAGAVWQALLEFNFFGPEGALSCSRMDSFKDFWESEVPRIGEIGATGWKNFENSSDAPDGKRDEETPKEYLQSPNIFDGWLFAELFREKVSREPARTMDDVTEDDPYRVILWSDIEELIIDLSTCSNQDYLKKLLLDGFLLFSRLPPCSNEETSRKWWEDTLVRGDQLEWSPQNLDSQFNESISRDESERIIKHGGHPTDEIAITEPVSFHHALSYSFIIDVENLFATLHWGSAFQPWKDLYGGDFGPIPYEVLRNTLKSVVSVTSDDLIAQYHLAFEWTNEPQSVKKVAKGLLKHRPHSLQLYNAYAMIEWLRGNKETAIKVIIAALSMKPALPKSHQQNNILLWKTWAWLLLEDGDNQNALKCIFCIADGQMDFSLIEVSSPALLLKTRQHISSMRDHLLSTGVISKANIYTELLALEAYLSGNSGVETISRNQGDIISALKVFESYFATLISRGYETNAYHELSHQSAARLLYHHMRSGPFRPAIPRHHLYRSLSLFPKNTLLLSIYAHNESGLRIDARVRSLLTSTILTQVSDTLTSRLFAIRHEFHVGNIHSVRAAFEHAVTSPVCSSNPGLWRLYLALCVQTKEFNDLAKDVFYRAIKACPWAKRLYLMAFRELKGIMEFDEMRAVYRVLGEKELRVHVDLEERFEEWDKEHGRKRVAGS